MLELRWPRGGRARVVSLALCSIVLVTACSDDGGSAATTTLADEPTDSTTTTVERPEGPVAALEELTGGNGAFMGAAATADLTSAGYVEQEFAASGTATSYRPEGELTEDGEWSFVPDDQAEYRTRVLVRRPADPADASGVVVVEWLNVSGGLDANPDWSNLEAEILREGHTWVGVSAQLIGVEGGPVLVTAPGAGGLAGAGLVSIDAERYGSLSHPGDGYSFDMFTQVARAMREGGEATGGATPELLLAAGESQSAIALTTYYNGVQPLTEAFDGFFVHSRAGVALPLVGPGESADLAGSIGGSVARLRTDQRAPVLTLQAEGDVTGVLNSFAARQDDTPRFRLWEVAGTAHADATLLGPLATIADCGAPINDGPLHVVAKAALRRLVEWSRDGIEPPSFERLEVQGTPPSIVRDGDGIATGGVRTPPVDVPVVVLSGDPGPSPDLFCLLLGSTTPLPDERVAELYGSRADYERRYAEALDDAVAAGVTLEPDREAMIAFADPEVVSG